MSADLSVVICTNRAPVHVRTSLDAVDHQTIRDRLEIIVVDDGAPGQLIEICRDYGAVLCRHPRNLGLAAARNTGWRAATAPLVAFTDDDCRPLTRWAEVLRDAYADPCVVAVGGRVRPSGTVSFLDRYYALSEPIAPLEVELAESPTRWHRLKLYLRRNLFGPRETGRRPVYSLPGASMSVRRGALEAVGGFDPGIRFGGEDEDLFHRLRELSDGSIFLFDPDAVTEHDFAPCLVDALRRARSYGRGNARNFVKHPGWGATVFPVPLLGAVLLAAGLHRLRWSAVGALLPVLAFPRWALEARHQRRPGPVMFAYLQFLEEAASDVGFAAGYLRFRREVALCQ
jgi:glycosyltransferase involved in cell wall biosynthesis